MSVKLRFDSPSDGGLVHRSRSFTGLGSLNARQRPLSARNSLRAKVLSGGKSPRVHLFPGRGSGVICSQQPEEVDRVFQALRKGLKECLEGHQAEMDFLSSQQRDTKRNSRLAFLYDLEKEIRALERYIRRLEFQISKVEELYETYCIQWKLSQGAVNMKRAFSLAPSSRASRESLLELGRNHRHSLQDMLAMEGELEILLGELHIKMKGLMGFARLCPGDQYEVVVRLGRQRWRIRGKIESDDTQLWDEEEMVFLPHIHHNFEIKVSEAKGLGWLPVGTVTCASADFFVLTPQLMLVDVTELGTLKLQLEVTWNPFDGAEKSKPLSVNKLSVSSRKSSVYSWTPPNTPSFTEKYFVSMMRELRDQEGSLPSLLTKSRQSRGGVSLLNYLSNPSHTSGPPDPGPHTPHTLRLDVHHRNESVSQCSSMVEHSHSLKRPRSSPSSPSPGTSLGGSRSQLSLAEKPFLQKEAEEKFRKAHWGSLFQDPSSGGESKDGSILTLQRSSTPDILRKNVPGEPEPGVPDPHQNAVGVKKHFPPVAPTRVPASCQPSAATPSGAQRRASCLRLGVLMSELQQMMSEQSCSDQELRAFNQQILHLATILKNDLSLMRNSSSEETLAVEEVLGSFDFLSHDFSGEDDASYVGSLRLKDSGMSSVQHGGLGGGGLGGGGLLPIDSQSVSEGEEPIVAPLTSGNWGLDQAIETHLDICCILLQTLLQTDFSPSRRELLLDVALQTEVLDRVSGLLLEKNNNIISTDEVLPKAQRTRDVLLLWDECETGSSSPFCCHVDNFSRTLRRRYTHKVKAKQPGQSEKVFSLLVQQLQSVCPSVPCSPSLCSPDRVTVFQLSVYLKRWSIHELGQHIYRLSKEEHFLSALRGPKRRRALNRLRGRRVADLLPLSLTLRTLSSLQTDSNHKVCKAAADCIRRANGCKAFRTKALVYFTQSLRSADVPTQHASCLALKCLRATESVDHIADLWRSPDEDLRSAARETILSFGKKGYEAFQRMDQLYNEMQEEAYQNQETQITVL